MSGAGQGSDSTAGGVSATPPQPPALSDAGTQDQTLFAASEQARLRLREVARQLLDGDGEDAEAVDAAEIERLHEEMMANYAAALKVFERQFAKLPYIEQLREKWKAYKLGDEDPVWAIVDVLTLYDARSQLVMTQVMNVITKGHDLLRVSIARLERLSKNVGSATGELAKHEAEFVKAKVAAETLAKNLAVYGELQPQLLDAMARSKAENETSTWRAKLQLMGIGAVVALGGYLLGKVF